MSEHSYLTRLRHQVSLTVLLLLGLRASGAEGVIDWETNQCAPGQSFQGLLVVNSDGYCLGGTPNPTVSNGTTTISVLWDIEITHQFGLPFTPLSVDLGEYSDHPSASQPHALTFTGHKEGEPPVSATFTIDGLRDGPGGIEDFETFAFPPEFAGITKLDCPTTNYSFDNLRFETPIPPPLPNPDVLTSFSSATTIYTRPIHDDHLVIGPDYFYATGFHDPDHVHFLDSPGSLVGPLGFPWVDPASHAVFYKSSSSLYRTSSSGATLVVTLAQLATAGFPEQSISTLRPHGSGHLFKGSSHDPGFYGSGLFKKDGTVISVVMDLNTQLIAGQPGSTPTSSGQHLTTFGSSYAFEVRFQDSPTLERVFRVTNGQQPALLASEGQAVDATDPENLIGDLISVEELNYTVDGQLILNAETTKGLFEVVFDPSSSIPVLFRTLETVEISPVNLGRSMSGTLYPTQRNYSIFFPVTGGEIFRSVGDEWHRIIGVGDQIGPDTITYLSYLGTPPSAPDRVILDVRFDASPSVARNVELILSTPAELAPRMRGIQADQETGALFLTVDRLTHGREYHLQSSSLLDIWNFEHVVEEVLPVQHLFISPEVVSGQSFFRIIEVPASP